jgi:hypothetical protein
MPVRACGGEVSLPLSQLGQMTASVLPEIESEAPKLSPFESMPRSTALISVVQRRLHLVLKSHTLVD